MCDLPPETVEQNAYYRRALDQARRDLALGVVDPGAFQGQFGPRINRRLRLERELSSFAAAARGRPAPSDGSSAP